jgi:hypothetical protein
MTAKFTSIIRPATLFLTCMFAGSRALADPAADAAIWLDRAQRDIASLPAQTPKEFSLLNPDELATQLYLTAPTDQRRALAIARLDAHVKDYLEQKEYPEQKGMSYTFCAMEHAKLGDFEGARRYLALAGQPPVTVPSTNPLGMFMDGFVDQSRAEADLLLGDTPAFERLKLSALVATNIANDLRSIGKLTEADIADHAARRAAKAEAQAHAGSQKKSEFDGRNRADAADALAMAGDFDGAMKIAATADDGPPDKDGFKMPAGYYTFSAYVNIARYAQRAKDPDHFRSAATAAIAILHKIPNDVDDTSLAELVEYCAASRDAALFAPVAQIHLSYLEHDRSYRDNLEKVYSLATLARDFAAMGNKPASVSAADAAEKILTARADTSHLSDDEKRDRPRKVAMGYLWVAAARARARDLAGVDRDVEASRKVTDLEPNSWDEPWDRVIHSYIDAGLLDNAVSALSLSRADEEYGPLHVTVGWALAKAGRFDEAWKLSAKTATGGRIMLEYRLTVAEVGAHREKQVAARVNGLPSAYEKAMVELAIAQAMTDQTYRGDFRVFRARDE